MAARMGIMPWDRDRLTPAQLTELWDGFRWRRSRDMEVLSHSLLLQGAMHGAELDYDTVIGAMPGYDGERNRQIEAMRQKALSKGKKRKRGG